MAVALSSLFTVRAASWDTQQRLPYNRQRTKPKKPQNPPTTTTPTLTLTATPNNTIDSSISALLQRKIRKPIRGIATYVKNWRKRIWVTRHGCRLHRRWRSRVRYTMPHRWRILGTVYTSYMLGDTSCFHH
ncbi:hypothetical protein RHGRI_025089 [Rhododendron griersonianum]|uniref:Secreted protein n=1 Tax=Rhododendron griersonianum TaxID=479676 RepID=A0AAV6J9R9_9ERIC|nr:hypothetical protein RHGRI_025089 [Rhododendron griersonianum]